MARSCNVISIVAKEPGSDANKLTDSDDESQVLAVNPMVVTTSSGWEFTQDYDQETEDRLEELSAPVEVAVWAFEPVWLPAPQPLPPKPIKATNRQPKSRYAKLIIKATNKTKPIHFDIVK